MSVKTVCSSGMLTSMPKRGPSLIGSKLVKWMRFLRLSKKRDGFSLVEVLIALVVFTAGILTIIRVFPTGLGIIRNSQNVTVADRLAEAELERLKNGIAHLPAGILSFVQGVGFVDTDPDLYSNLMDIAGTQYSDLRFE